MDSFEELHATIASAIESAVKDLSVTYTDIGTITAGGALQTRKYPTPIPRADYLIGRVVSGWAEEIIKTEVEPVEHFHKLKTKKIFTQFELHAGDKVLVVWVDNTPVVVDVLM
ncbi:MAG: hypothetical protein Q4G33_04640 [bacterium]|nr:hypothetical protein [bacterium]